MKPEIHPEYVLATVTCSCGNTFQTRSTKPELHVEICSNCHPFYTGKQKLVDTGGRVERFQRRDAKRGTAEPSPHGGDGGQTGAGEPPLRGAGRSRRRDDAPPRAPGHPPAPARPPDPPGIPP